MWAGTVSHHLLADEPIDNWFQEIARRRKVETFFVICPSHYGLSTEEWSLDNCRWQTAKGIVYTNETAEEAIAAYDENGFYCLKHVIKDGIVSASYVVFIITQVI